MQLMLALALATAVAAVSFALQNTDPVFIRFLHWRLDGSLALVRLIPVWRRLAAAGEAFRGGI
jgi:hypothetical protein